MYSLYSNYIRGKIHKVCLTYLNMMITNPEISLILQIATLSILSTMIYSIYKITRPIKDFFLGMSEKAKHGTRNYSEMGQRSAEVRRAKRDFEQAQLMDLAGDNPMMMEGLKDLMNQCPKEYRWLAKGIMQWAVPRILQNPSFQQLMQNQGVKNINPEPQEVPQG